MNSTIHLIGINHRTAAVEVREKFALTNFCSPDTWAIPNGEGIRESLILSTCNRVEVLVVGDGDAPRRRALQCWLIPEIQQCICHNTQPHRLDP